MALFKLPVSERGNDILYCCLSKGSFPYQSTLEYSNDSRDLRRTTEINAKRQNDVDGSKLMERAPIASCMSKYCTEEASRAALPSPPHHTWGKDQRSLSGSFESGELCPSQIRLLGARLLAPVLYYTTWQIVGIIDLCGRYTESVERIVVCSII